MNERTVNTIATSLWLLALSSLTFFSSPSAKKTARLRSVYWSVLQSWDGFGSLRVHFWNLLRRLAPSNLSSVEQRSALLCIWKQKMKKRKPEFANSCVPKTHLLIVKNGSQMLNRFVYFGIRLCISVDWSSCDTCSWHPCLGFFHVSYVKRKTSR